MRNFIENVYTRVPATFPRYKLAKADFHTGATGDESYLRDERSRLFHWLGLSQLDPKAEVRELRQMTLYRPDTFYLLQHLATVIIYLFHFDCRILTNRNFGEAPIERLITVFMSEPDRFSPNGRQLSAQDRSGSDKTQNAVKSTPPAGFQNVSDAVDRVVAAAIVADTAASTGENIQIAGETSVASLEIEQQISGFVLENEVDGFEWTIESDDRIECIIVPGIEPCIDQYDESDHAKTNGEFEEEERV